MSGRDDFNEEANEELMNVFADVQNVGQLFDALWYGATRTVLAAQKHEGAEHVEGYIQRAREMAIGDAHKRYQELVKQ